MNNDIIGFIETQVKPSYSTSRIVETLTDFNIKINNNENKFLILAYGCRNDGVGLKKIDANRVSVSSLMHSFAGKILTLMLAYRKQYMHMREIFKCCNIF